MLDTPVPVVAPIGGTPRDMAIQITGAYKRYAKGPWILNNLHMAVPKSGIYGLLGSSGCGKTTLLTALTGFASLDYGTINMSITSPRQLGFMPQEIALFEEFTIGETFSFFSRLYNIPEDKFQAVVKDLKSVLDLPADSRLCSTLSGGQARRVSIAVTLLHSPDIVILDEPTSGVDPLLAHCFWQYLMRLSRSEGRTIIITTHYIEEARQADMVALMRNGVLLAEAPPEDLISEYKVKSLEDVFLTLCHVQNKAEEEKKSKYVPKIRYEHPYSRKSQDFTNVWPHTKAIMYKIFTWARSNWPLFLTMSFLLSTSCIVVCNHMLTSFPPTKVGFVNDESGGDCANLTDVPLGCQRSQIYENLGCKFIRTWRARNPDIPMIHYSQFDQAMSRGRKGDIVAVLRISANFSRGVSARLMNALSADKNLITFSNIDVWGDTTEYMRTIKIEVEMQYSYIDMYRDLLTSCGYNSKVADMPPMQINTNLLIGDDVDVDMFDYTGYVTLNIISGLACLCAVLLIIPLLSVDKMSGVYARCHLAGVRTYEIFLAHFLFLSGYNLINNVCMLLVYYSFYYSPRGSIGLTYLILNVGGFSGIMLGLLVVLLARNITECTSFLIVYMIAMFSFTGYIWPLEAVWPPIQPLSYICFPNTYVTIALRAVEWKSASILHPEVVRTCAYTLAYVGVHVAVIWIVVRRNPSFTSN